MQKVIFSIFIFFSSIIFAKPLVIVSIAPEKTFVQKITKDKADVTVMVEAGDSPHSYEPKAFQMIALSKADIYFSIGVDFEKAWLTRFKSQNPKLKFVNLSDTISKIAMPRHNHESKDTHEDEGVDPHTWTSPKNVKIMAETIYETLSQIDSENEQFYKTNLNNFIKEIESTDKKIKEILKSIKPKTKFMVFHPSWGYFADAYDLIQVAVEVQGKSPKPKEMITIINEAKEEKVKVIFTQPEFSDKSAKIIAKETDLSVKKISPLNSEWSSNLINMARAIADNKKL